MYSIRKEKSLAANQPYENIMVEEISRKQITIGGEEMVVLVPTMVETPTLKMDALIYEDIQVVCVAFEGACETYYEHDLDVLIADIGEQMAMQAAQEAGWST